MKPFHHSTMGLRKQLIILILIILLPILAILLFTGYRQYYSKLKDIESNTRQLISLFSEEQLNIVNQTRQLLNIISHVPAVRDVDLDSCNVFLKGIHDDNLQYVTFIVSNSEGIINCCGIPLSEPIDITDREWFKRVKQSKEFVIGNFLISRSAKKASLPFAFPVLDDENNIISIVGAAYSLDNYGSIFSKIRLPEDSVIFVVDGSSKILYQSNANDENLGRSLMESRGFDIPQINRGNLSIDDADGIERLYRFERLSVGDEKNQICIMIGVSKRVIYAEARELLVFSLSLFAALATLCFVMAWFFGKKNILDPVSLLITKTRSVRKGDLTPSNAVNRMPGELGILSKAFDEMVGDLSRKEAERDKALDDLRNEIAQHKETVAVLRMREEHLRILFEQAADAIFVVDLVGFLVKVNGRACRTTGYTEEELLGMHVSKLDARITPSREAFQTFAEDVSHGRAVTVESVHRRKDGSTFPVEITISLLDTGDEPQLLGIARDITQRREAERAVRESEHRLKLAQEMAHLGHWDYRVATDELIWSQEVFRTFGLDPDIFTPTREAFYAAVHPDDVENVAALLAGTLVEGKSVDLIFRIVLPGGDIRHVHVYARSFLDEDDQPITVMGTVQDITDRKRSEEALRLHLAIMETVAEGILLLGVDDLNVKWANRKFEELLGYESGAMIGLHADEILTPVDMKPAEFGAPIRATVLRTGEWHGEMPNLRRDGSRFWSYAHVSLFDHPEFGRVMVSAHTDITERKRAEEEKERLEAQLRQAQKLEAIGTLAGGIAHDFNNILAPIIGYTEMAMGDIPGSAPMRHDLEQVLRAAHRARDLVRQILAVSRHGQNQERIPVDISSVVKEVLKLVRPSLPSSIEIRQLLESGVALADATQIHQVLVNLCTNAAHAMDGEGILTVSLMGVQLGGLDLIRLSTPELKPGAYLKLSVADTGHGMDDKTLQRIFDPYFTTKEVGKGTGLGLSVVLGIVKRHEGAVSVSSEPGKGSVFDIYLPRIGSGTVDTSVAPGEVPRGTERILIVDDERMAAELTTRILMQLGYDVTKETNALDALDRFQADPDVFDLVITDYTMPNITGTVLAAEILKIRPGMPIILCTGFSEKGTEDVAKDLGIRGYALKPLSRAQLAQLVRNVLDGKTD